MSIRKIVSAFPLVLGIAACSTSGTQSSSNRTGAMWPEREGRSDAVALTQGTGAQGQSQGAMASSDSTSSGASGSASGSSGTGSSGSTADSPSGSAGSMGSGAAGSSPDMGSGTPSGSSRTEGQGASGSGGSMGGSADQGTPGGSMGGTSDQGQHGSGGAMGSDQGTAQGSSSGGSDVAGHSDDQTVTGKVSKVSGKELSITPKGGEAKTLKIVKETIVTVNGKAAKPSQLKQGQQVRASYNQVDGQDVAVKIEVGKASSTAKKASNGHHGESGSTGSGSTGSGSTGSGSSGSGSGSGMGHGSDPSSGGSR